ncbi:MAG: M48 family metalloprotease [Gaiellales bacterium]
MASIGTRLRTWIFVAVLTALLLSVGAALGGVFVYAFAAVAIAMNAVGYWCSDRIALAANRARPLAEQDAPAVHAIVRELAHQAGVPAPRLYLVESPQPNAFATGRSPSRSAVAVTRGLLDQMSPQQVRAVLAHELAHIRNRDVRVSAIAAMIAGAVAAIANVLQFSMLFGGGDDDHDGPLAWVGMLAAVLIAPLAATLLQLAVSRQREYLADATAARILGGGDSLADALEQLEAGTREAPMAVNPAFASLYIANPLPRTGIAGLFSTHPPIAERVRRLRAFDGSPAAVDVSVGARRPGLHTP